MNLNHLQLFHAAAVTGSMTAAAASLSISQPAVSKQVRLLEAALKVQLFDRSAKPLRLTRAGEALAERARRIFALVAEADTALAELASLRRGRLTIGVTPTLGAYLLPEILIHFRRRFPGIELRAEIGNAAAVRSLVNDRSVDFALTDVSLGADAAAERVFATETLVIIAAPTNPLTRRRRSQLATLSALPFIVRETGASTRSFAESALAARGVVIRPVLTLASTEAIKRAVAGGLGIAIVPEMAVRSELEAKRLKLLQVRGLTLKRQLYVTTPHGRQQSKPAIAFLCQLKHALRGTLPKLPPITQ